MTTPKKEVATRQSTALAVAEEFESMPTGMEHVTAEDMLVPRLTVLQALSPQLKKSDPNFIPGAQQGMFCDTGTGELFAEELHILPVYFARVYLEWAPRGAGGGLVKNHGTNAAIMDQTHRDENNRAVLPSGNYIAETATYFCLNLTAGGRPSFIPMSSTQLKNSRRWMTLIKNEKLRKADGTEFTPPLYYRSWRARAVEESNAKGTWFGWRFEPAETVLELDPDKNLLRQAQQFCTDAAQGLVRGDLSEVAEDHSAPGNADTM